MLAQFKLAALRLASDRKGVTAIEYGLIAGAIAVTIIGAVVLVGSDINNLFVTTGNQLGTVAGK
jgi:pilus assembly protein Flp/PilA